MSSWHPVQASDPGSVLKLSAVAPSVWHLPQLRMSCGKPTPAVAVAVQLPPPQSALLVHGADSKGPSAQTLIFAPKKSSPSPNAYFVPTGPAVTDGRSFPRW